MAASYWEIETDITSLREENKADMQSLRDELCELGQLHTAQAEANGKYEEMGQSWDRMKQWTAFRHWKKQTYKKKNRPETPRQMFGSGKKKQEAKFLKMETCQHVKVLGNDN